MPTTDGSFYDFFGLVLVYAYLVVAAILLSLAGLSWFFRDPRRNDDESNP